jgi:hypothetical protein
MNTVEGVLKECESKSVILHVDGENLKYKAPPGAMTEDLRDAIASHKPKLIKILQGKTTQGTKQAVVDAITVGFEGWLSDQDFTRRYLILMRAWRNGVIDDQTKDQGLGFLLDHWKGSRQ